jgi:hypothetical protein
VEQVFFAPDLELLVIEEFPSAAVFGAEPEYVLAAEVEMEPSITAVLAMRSQTSVAI